MFSIPRHKLEPKRLFKGSGYCCGDENMRMSRTLDSSNNLTYKAHMKKQYLPVRSHVYPFHRITVLTFLMVAWGQRRSLRP